jgi:hypothetical protein
VSVITDSSTVSIKFAAYLPLLMHRWPPVPYQPSLHPISNPDSGASYTVSWTEQPSRLADTYTLEEATNRLFTNHLREVCATASRSCGVTVQSVGTYYYRVQGHNSWGDGPYSNVESVAVLPPAKPTINPIENEDGDGSYTVSWNPTAGANNFVLQEDTAPSFASPTAVYQGPNTSWDVTGMAAGTYYYRLRAWGPTGGSEWSSPRAVTVLLPGNPTLRPIDNADRDGSYTVSWSASARANNYVLQEDTDPGFASPTRVYQGSDTSWDATGKTAGTYYYRVRAWGETGHSEWSNRRSTSVVPPIEIVEHHGWTYVVWFDEDSTWLEVYCEVRNNTQQNVHNVELVFNVYNDGGTLVATDTSYSMLDVIRPGQSSPVGFFLDVPGGYDTLEDGSTSLRVRETWQTTSGDSQDSFQLLSHSKFKDDIGALHVVGEARNVDSQTRGLDATAYVRGKGKFDEMILAADSDWVCCVSPDERVSFEVILWYDFGDYYDRYTVVLERDYFYYLSFSRSGSGSSVSGSIGTHRVSENEATLAPPRRGSSTISYRE